MSSKPPADTDFEAFVPFARDQFRYLESTYGFAAHISRDLEERDDEAIPLEAVCEIVEASALRNGHGWPLRALRRRARADAAAEIAELWDSYLERAATLRARAAWLRP
jgi:hypothetical protein